MQPAAAISPDLLRPTPAVNPAAAANMRKTAEDFEASFLSGIENLSVPVDSPARVIIDEVNGVIVMGDAVRVSTVAIAQGNLTVSVQETPFVSQPEPFSRGETAVVPDSQVQIEEERGVQMRMVGGGEAEGTWRSFMIEAMAKQTVKAGGIGLADQVVAQMLKMQEQSQ